jgi:hypothetical protein
MGIQIRGTDDNISASDGSLTIDGVNYSTLQVNGNNYPATGPLSNRNKIINGDCRIDQRNAGASGTAAGFTVDRWLYFASQASKGTWQQNAGAVTPPVGFDYYLGYTSSSSYTLLSGDIFGIAQAIEGYNISDLAYGTANAKPLTISFWVRSSLTGLFGGFLKNGGTSGGNNTRFCPFSYTINSANTWEYKTITINGDTAGSWESTNGPAFAIAFSLGNGSTYTGGTSGTWSGTQYLQPSGCVNLVATNGATLYLTGIQIEVGTVATPFEHRSYGDELARCQRYYYDGGQVRQYSAGYSVNARGTGSWINFPVTMRDTATVTQSSITYSGANTAQVHNASAHGFTSYFISQADNTTWCQFNYVAEKEL